MAEYYFKLPDFGDLTTTQQGAVLDDHAIALSGGPGTGKSVVSLWRHILNHQREISIESQLLTYTTSLALYLRKCCATKNVDASLFVDSSINWVHKEASHRDEIIHDEAQDLPLLFNQDLKNFSTMISYGSDDQQLIIGQARNQDGIYNIERCSPERNLRQEFPNNSIHILSENYRNSKKIMKLAKKLFTEAVIPQEIIDSCKIDGETFPRLIITGNNNSKINDSVIQLIRDFSKNETVNIGVLVPFENPNRIAGETSIVQYYYDLIQNSGFDCSKYTNSMLGCDEIKNIHITTFKSAKGLEFDVVILPDFQFYNQLFKVVDWHDFYVGVTRTKSNLFLISRTDLVHLPSDGKNKIIDKVYI
jgi:DNA helicase IV